MKRWIKRAGFGLALLLAVPVGIYAVSWVRGPTPAQRRALDLMSTPPPAPAGSNAFVDVWTIRVNADARQRQRIADADVARFNAHPETSLDPPGYSIDDEQMSEQHLCATWQPGCLAMVRANLDATSARLALDAGLRTRAMNALDRHTFLASPFALNENMTFAVTPLMLGMRLLLTQAALDFAQGRQSEGLATTCRLVSGWERWMRHPDLLIDQMLGVAYLQSALRLQADMLADLRSDADTPAECAVMRQLPDWQAASICAAGKREFQFMDITQRRKSVAELIGTPNADRLQRGAQHIFYRREATRALLAERMAYACGTQVAEALERDIAIAQPDDEMGPRLECVFNLLGCVLTANAKPLESYQRRVQDYGARRRLVAVLWQLRDGNQAELPLPDRVLRLPASLRAGRDIEVTEDGKLRIELFEPIEEQVNWTLPVPGSAVPRAAN